MQAMRRFAVSVLPLLVALSASGALALPVSIEPGGYAGQWVLSNTGYTGATVLDLAPGTYNVSVGWGGFSFSVAADGSVTVSNPVAAEGGASRLRFHTVPVTVEPGAYAGFWTLHLAANKLQGPHTLQLVPGLSQLLRVGGYGSVRFELAADGTVSTQATASATASGSTLTLRTTPVAFDPGDYAGSWSLDGISTQLLQGPRTLALVPALSYRLNVGGWGGFPFSVAADGTVSTEATASATASGQALTFHTVGVSINTRDYAGFWSIDAVTPQLQQHTHTVRLVPGVQYRLFIGGRDGFSFAVAADGSVSTGATASAVGHGGTLVLNTVPVRIAPYDPSLAWGVDAALSPLPFHWSGTHTLKLVPGITYLLRRQSPYATAFFFLSDACAPSPATLEVGGSGFALSCTP